MEPAGLTLEMPTGGIALSAEIALLAQMVRTKPSDNAAKLRYLNALSAAFADDTLLTYANTLLSDIDLDQGVKDQARRAVSQALVRLERYDDAVSILEQILAEKVAGSQSLRLLARCFARTGRADEALAILDEVLASSPRNADALTDYRFAAKAANEPGRADTMARNLFNNGIRNGTVLNAFIKAGLSDRDPRADEMAELAFGLIKFTTTDQSETLAKADPAQIHNAILDSPDLRPISRDKPAEKAHRLVPFDWKLLQMMQPVFKAAEERLNALLNTLGESPERLNAVTGLLGPVPERCKISAWATVYDAKGHHTPHNHPSWFSGVYYPAARKPPSGAICFGYDYEKPDLRFDPQPGALVLFPSHIPHWTEEAEAGSKRISVAFDLHPAKVHSE